MRNWRNYIALVLVLIVVAFAFKSAEAQNGGEEHFPGNFVVTGDFLKFYRSAPDPQLLFGNALSNVLDMNGTLVQYFDRARFELKDTGHGMQVQLAPLGELYFEESKTSSAAIPPSSPTCRFFPKYGHRVCYDFLKFYDAHNGPEYFGSPVSEMVSENGIYVQYFEFAKFEYRYNMPVDMKVGLVNIGRLAMKIYYGKAPMPSYIVRPGNPQGVPAIQARAFVSRALVAPGSTNTLYVVVHLQDFKGVANAKVTVSVVIGDKETSLLLANTDADGIARIDIPAFDLAPRQTVQLQAVVNYGEQAVKTSTWYRFWY